jgi:hypothetical protein
VRRGRRRPAGPHGLPLSDGELDELGERLEARLVRREAALAARARDLQTKLDELREAQAASLETAQDGAAELADRERQLAARIAAAAKREAELARRAAEVALRERESVAEQEEAAAAAAAAAAAEAAAVTAPPPPASPGGATRGRYNLVGLEQLVGERGGAFPERLEEWSSYLYFLREYAASDGSLPASFDPLVGDTFGEILA